MNKGMTWVVKRSKNSWWMARMASWARSLGTITEILRSEEPWAVARTGMLWCPRAASIWPVAPLCPRMSSPMTQTMEK
ncbi:MAG: hypothetical protein II421_00280, partial [Bacteroidales bacterium]|nr:hypothetical protein [Bacteroidales bacterium]